MVGITGHNSEAITDKGCDMTGNLVQNLFVNTLHHILI